MFLFLLFTEKLINFIFQIFSLFISEMPAGFKYCSGYPYLFRLDPVTTAMRLVSFDLITFSTLHQTMAYASSVHNNINSFWLKF
jgi:hypothetical protein